MPVCENRESPYEVRVDGTPLTVERGGVHSGAYYARFHYAHPVRVEVRVRATAATALVLKPERFRTNLESKDQRLAVDVDSPGPRVVTAVCGSRELWPLVIFAEHKTDPEPAKPWARLEPALPDDVRTAELQWVLDECAAAGGGAIEFMPGVYRTGPLYVRDNTTVRLLEGSRIVSSGDPADFAAAGEVNRHNSACPTANRPALINFDGCANSALEGEGAVVGMGHILRNEFGVNASLVRIIDCRDIRLEGVLLLDSPSWTVHCFASRSVTFDRVKIINDWSVGNTDGINPDCSQNVTISNYFGYCGDDAVAVKTTSSSDELQGSSGIKVVDSVVMTRKTAFKIGTETHKDVSDVTLSNCDAINTSRGIGIYVRDGGRISGVGYRDVRLDLMEYPGEKTSGSPFTVEIARRHGTGAVDGVRFERVTAWAPYASKLSGLPDSPVRNVEFSDCSFEVRDRSIKLARKPVFAVDHCDGLRFERCDLHWNTVLADCWDGLVCVQNSSRVDTEGVIEHRKE